MSGHIHDLTAAQAATLSEFRAKLAGELKTLGLEKPSLYGVSLEGLEGEAPNKAQNVVLLKFLRAREFKLDAAFEMIVRTLKWRSEFKIESILSETFSPAFDALGYVHGKDREDHPVTYNFYGKIDINEIFTKNNGIDTFVRWRVQLMEKAVALLDFENGNETVTQIHDYNGVSFFSMEANVRAASKVIIQLFQDHYPEFLQAKFFMNVPTLMEWIFSLLSSFSSARTTGKFLMVGRGSVRSTLLQHIEPTNLPSIYGGFEASSNPVEEVASKGVEKAVILAGRKKVVEFEVDAGQVINWEWISATSDVAVGAHVVQGDPAAAKEPKLERAEDGRGSLTAESKGSFRFIFDNTSSYFSDKEVYYKTRISKA